MSEKPLIDSTQFQAELSQKILQSEQLRSLVFLVCLLCVFVQFVVLRLTEWFPPGFFEMRWGLSVADWLILIFIAGIAFECLVWMVLRRNILHDRSLAVFPYVTACIEMTLPSVGILIISEGIPPIEVLSGPPILVYGLFIVLSALRLDFRLCLYTGTLAALNYLVLSHFFILPITSTADYPFLGEPVQGVVKAMTLFLTGLSAGFVAREIKKFLMQSFQSHAEKQSILELFGQHVSPRVVRTLLSENGGDGQLRHVCVMFLDIRGFTSIAERQSPEQTVQYLNQVFERMIQIINQHEGIINKFLGDGFMAVFGPPFSEKNPSQAAVKAALEIVQYAQQATKLQEIPPTRIGIGLHSGEALTGNVGSSFRKEFTVIGDVVNLASRLEQLNKAYQAQLLVSESVYRELEEAHTPLNRFDDVQVKGREKALVVYQLA